MCGGFLVAELLCLGVQMVLNDSAVVAGTWALEPGLSGLKSFMVSAIL